LWVIIIINITCLCKIRHKKQENDIYSLFFDKSSLFVSKKESTENKKEDKIHFGNYCQLSWRFSYRLFEVGGVSLQKIKTR
jgi:hypothetical protein